VRIELNFVCVNYIFCGCCAKLYQMFEMKNPWKKKDVCRVDLLCVYIGHSNSNLKTIGQIFKIMVLFKEKVHGLIRVL